MDQQFNPDISALELRQQLDGGAAIHLIDVREELEFYTFNIGGSNIPLGSLATALDNLKISKEESIVVVCQHGIRSESARRLMSSNGFKKVRNLVGGILAYRKSFLHN